MPSSNKATAVQGPTIRNVRPSQLGKDGSSCPSASNATSTASQMASMSAQDAPKLPNMSETPRIWTYRVRGIPIGLDWESSTSLIQSTLRLRHWELRSLAPDPIRNREQVATLEILQPPYSTLEPRPDSQWQFSVSHIPNEDTDSPDRSVFGGNFSVGDISATSLNLPDRKVVKRRRKATITVDQHFLGLTPLNRWDESQNYIDCIAISGLGGHAFGSFKDKDSQYMWLRDSLPDDFPDLRIFIYGYESGLQGSNSFQNLRDVGESFRDSLRDLSGPQNSSNSQRSRPLIFIGHSLGGLVIKEALTLMVDSDDVRDQQNLKATYGALFFGVPSRGMDIDSLRPMVSGQPNESFLMNLARDSELLMMKSENFCKAFNFESSKVLSFYETDQSPTASLNEKGKYTMKGARAMLVDKTSAISGRHWEQDQNYVIGLPKDHSNLVKFYERDNCYDRVRQYLERFTSEADAAIQSRLVPTEYNERYNKNMEKRLAVMHQQIDPSSRIDSFTKKRCLHSLWIADYETKLQLVPAADPGTCTWVADHTKYRKWISGKREPIVWLLGGPGSGKTVLSAYLIKEIRKDAKGTLVTHFHCDKDRKLLSSTETILSSLLHQILAKNSHLVDHAVREFETRPRGFSDSLGTLCTVLGNVLQDKNCPKVYCVLDALDECSNPQALLKELSTHYSSHINDHRHFSVKSPIRFLITSQPSRSYENYALLPKFSTMIDMTTAENFRSREVDIRHSIKERVSILPFSSKVKRKVHEHLEKGADGMYLWVSLTLDELAKTPSGNVEQVLRSTPKDLDERYTSFLCQIRRRSRDWASQIIRLIFAALRPLSVSELYLALKLSKDETDCVNKPLDEDTLDNFESDLRLCGPIIKVQDMHLHGALSHSRTVTLVHPTAKDFLTRNFNRRSELFKHFYVDSETAHLKLGEVCIKYLYYTDLGKTFAPPSPREQVYQKFRRVVTKAIELQDFSRRYPLLDYATQSWLQHCTTPSQKPDIGFLEFFRRFAILDMARWKWIWWRLNVPYSMDLQNLSYNDAQAKPYVREALESYQPQRDLESKVTNPATEIMLFLTRDLQTSPLLPVLWRANRHRLSLRDEYGRTLLHYAALEGWAHSIDLLVGYMRNDLNIQDHAKSTALHIAVMPVREDQNSARLRLAKALLDEGADTEIEDASGMTPLLLAIQFGMYDMVKLLLEVGSADPTAVDAYEGPELDMAIEFSGDVVQPDGGTISSLLEHHQNNRDWVMVWK